MPSGRRDSKDDGSNWPVFTVNRERSPWQTDEQYEHSLRDAEQHAKVLGAYLALFQTLCTLRGFPADCRHGRCRRLGKCVGRRPEFDDSVAFKPFVPPCVPMYYDLVEEMRAEIRAELEYRKAEYDARKGKGDAAPYPPPCGEGRRGAGAQAETARRGGGE